MGTLDSLREQAFERFEAGQYAASLALLEQAIQREGDADPFSPQLLEVQLKRVSALRLLGRKDEAMALARAAVAQSVRLGDPGPKSQAFITLGFCLLDQGDTDSTGPLALQARELAKEAGVATSEISALHLLAGVFHRRDQPQRALTEIREALALAEAAQSEHLLGRLLAQLAETLALTGDPRGAADAATRSLALARRRGHPYQIVRALHACAVMLNYTDRAEEAAVFADESVALAEQLGSESNLLDALLCKGDAARARGLHDEAEAAYLRGQRLSGISQRLRRFADLNLAILANGRGVWPEAAAQAEQLIARGGGTVGTMGLALALAAQLALGELEQAEAHERRARHLLPTLGRAEPDIADALERGAAVGVALEGDPRAAILAARCLVLAWAIWQMSGREAPRARIEAALVGLAERGTPVPLGRYDLLARIGAGGMGEVWRALDRDAGEMVAIKLLTASAARADANLAALRAELRAVARLNHAGVVTIYDSGQVDGAAAAMTGGRLVVGSPYLVMELCEGNLLPLCGLASWETCAEVLAGLLSALAHAHARGVVHLDIKPDNVLLVNGAMTRLTDFGLARATGELASPMAGTPAYMAPEQIRGEGRLIGPWTDLYALGCLAWALLTGAPPHGRGDAATIMEARLTQDPRALIPARPLPGPLRDWLNRLLARDPAERYQVTADAAQALRALGPDLGAGVLGEVAAGSGAGPLDSTSTFLFDETVDVDEGGEAPGDAPAPRLADEPVPIPLSWQDGAERQSQARSSLMTFGLREPPVFGRAEERDALWAALQAGGRRAVVLTGAAGVGKTRLLQWLSCRAQETGAAHAISVAGATVAPSLRALLRWTGLHGARLRTAIGEALGVEDDATQRAIAALCEPGPPNLRGDDLAERARALRRPLAKLARRGGVVLVLDDAHGDPLGLELIVRLLEDPEAPDLLAVVAARDDLLALAPAQARLMETLLASPSTRRLPLPPLPDDALGALLRSSLQLDPLLAERVAERAHGNPLFALELVGDWVARELLVQGERGLRLRDGSEIALPASLREVWTRRLGTLLAGLPADAGSALELAATSGLTFDERGWRALAAQEELSVPPELIERLLDAHLATRERGVWRLAHGMFREAVLQRAADGGRLPRWHRAVARQLDVQAGDPLHLAEHLLKAGELARGLGLLFDSDRVDLSRRGAPEVLSVLDAAEQALRSDAVSPQDPRLARLRVARARALRRLGLLEEARHQALAAAEGALRGGLEDLHAQAMALVAPTSPEQVFRSLSPKEP